MKTMQWATVDKSTWGEGPWQQEPDKVQFQDDSTRLPCLIVRNPGVTGALCGYVGVREGHPLYKVEYNDCSLPTAMPRGEQPGNTEMDLSAIGGKKLPIPPRIVEYIRNQKICPEGSYCGHSPGQMLSVHGGITFSDSCQEGGLICHVDEEDKRPIWWFGFDCSHAWDISPKMDSITQVRVGRESVYRDIRYVRKEIRDLAKQLHDLEQKKLT